MTKNQIESEALRFAIRVKAMAKFILAEGNDFDCYWHRGHANALTSMCDDFLKKIR